jgi:hypothetical protein
VLFSPEECFTLLVHQNDTITLGQGLKRFDMVVQNGLDPFGCQPGINHLAFIHFPNGAFSDLNEDGKNESDTDQNTNDQEDDLFSVGHHSNPAGGLFAVLISFLRVQ